MTESNTSAPAWPSEQAPDRPVHDWLRDLDVSYVPGPRVLPLERMVDALLDTFRRMGHRVQTEPDSDTDVILTTARFGEPLDWRDALLFTARRRLHLEHSPTVYTLVHVDPGDFQGALNRLRAVLPKSPPDPADYNFPGMADEAYRVLFEQGRRGGPILALQRVIQSQAKCIEVLLVVGDDRLREAYLFNLVGAYPCIPADDLDFFYQDIVARIVTAESTQLATDHLPVDEPVPRHVWERLSTPGEMCNAGRQLGLRGFFTEMVRIADLVKVPALADVVAAQYSEGCFSTWDPTLDALIATATGSARPVYKGSISEGDLTVVVGLRPDGRGALVRHIEGQPNPPPSSEAVEMVKMDQPLPRITLGTAWDCQAEAPVVRSKLHGHRGVGAYNPRRVEYVSMAPPYQHYPVTCATDAQARGIEDAFSRSEALQNPDDPRQVVYTVLPGHGTVIVEKWAPRTAPFEAIWRAMDLGYLEIDRNVPQQSIEYVAGPGDRRVLRAPEQT
ncbi:MAG: hypothetical protein PVG71_05340 [Anaerolineae bacterium]